MNQKVWETVSTPANAVLNRDTGGIRVVGFEGDGAFRLAMLSLQGASSPDTIPLPLTVH